MPQIKQCEAHGYFRGDRCPICGSEGKFLLNDWELEALSRMLSGILRHFPYKFRVNIDPMGWADIYDIVNGIKRRHRRFWWLRRHHIEAIALTDPKGRFQVDLEKKKIRATYGHTIPVDLSDLPTDDIPEILYYPVSREEADILLESGLKPTDRRWVHLSFSYEDAYIAGRHRMDDVVVLAVKTKCCEDKGIKIHRAAKTIFITTEVPPECLEMPEQREVELSEEELKAIEMEKKRKEKKMRKKMRRKKKNENTDMERGGSVQSEVQGM